MDKRDVVIVYLSLSLLISQYFWMKEAKDASYYRGKSEMLEYMNEMTDKGVYHK